jgi:hypothetical protein
MDRIKKSEQRAGRLHEYSWERDEAHFARNFLAETNAAQSQLDLGPSETSPWLEQGRLRIPQEA